MKTFNYLLVIAATLFLATSCVESSNKYKTLAAQKDSLQSSINTLETDFNETLEILNNVEEGFRNIAQEEGKLTINMENTSTLSRKQQVAEQVTQIKEILAQNRESIKQLQQKLNRSNKNNKVLAETIKRMEEQLNEKTVLIVSLQEELAKKNIKIDELTASVDNLNSDVTKLQEKSKEQEGTIKSMDTDLNTVWYCIATSKELKAANIKSNGKVLNKDFNRDAFTTADMRDVKSLPLNVRRAKILSSHPQGSYNLEVNEDKNQTLVITDPQQFWSVSKYLIVQR